jgi:hypothetical protein
MERTVDVLIAGAGQVGLAVAVAIASARPSLEILVIDAAPEDAWQRDSRASAIASAPMRMLDRLGCGAGIREHAEPIREMIITDSRTGDPVRPVLLTFGGEVGPGEPFAHMVPNRVICETLRRRLGELGVAIGNGAARGCWLQPMASAPSCGSWRGSGRSVSTTGSRALSALSPTSARMGAGPWSISCQPARSRPCR